jgi:SAM-dependent methyltransferase
MSGPVGDEHTSFVGSIPEFYDRYLGPLLFHPFADDLVERTPDRPGILLLETACGTGVVTERLLGRLREPGAFVATDLNLDMLSYARSRIGEGAPITWQQADATTLPFGDGSFDAVVCQFGLMFLPDETDGMREASRVLRPGGLFLFNVWDAVEHNPAQRITHETAGSFFPTDPPQFYAVPFRLHDSHRVLDRLAHAGFTEIEHATIDRRGESPSAAAAARGLIEGNPIRDAILARDPAALAEIEPALERNLAAELGDHPLRAPLRAHVFAARRSGRGATR